MCSNVTHVTGPRNCCKMSLPHQAAPSHSFSPHFHGLLLSTWPHRSLHRQNDAAWKLPLFVGEGVGTTDTDSATGPDASCSYTQSFCLSCLILALKFSKRWVGRLGRVNVRKQRAALLPGAYQRWQDSSAATPSNIGEMDFLNADYVMCLGTI